MGSRLGATAEWGTIGDWVSSSIALVAVVLTLHMWRRDRAQARREAEHRVAEEMIHEAASVNCWVQTGSMTEDRARAVIAVLQNGTASPVYWWRAVIFVDPPAREVELVSEEHGAIPPHGGKLEVELAETSAGRIVRSEMQFSYALADGAKWRRRSDGTLQTVIE